MSTDKKDAAPALRRILALVDDLETIRSNLDTKKDQGLVFRARGSVDEFAESIKYHIDAIKEKAALALYHAGGMKP